MNNHRPIWSINLKTARKLQKLTQEEIAAKIYKTQEAYNRYESGQRQPDMATWILICDVLEVQDLIKFINQNYFSIAAWNAVVTKIAIINNQPIP
jgi:transcriptional regulator with XRE-family HTH domain